MAPLKPVPGTPVPLLEADPDLGGDLAADRLVAARTRLVVPTLRLQAGEVDLDEHFDDPSTQLGVLLVDGLLTREIVIAATRCAELLGVGDFLMPWGQLGEGAPVPTHVEWHVLEPTTLAVLDQRFAAAAAVYPEVMAALLRRAVGRAQTLAVSLAISSHRLARSDPWPAETTPPRASTNCRRFMFTDYVDYKQADTYKQ